MTPATGYDRAMRRSIQILENPDAATLLAADVAWWQAAPASARMVAMDEARRDAERMGIDVSPTHRRRGGVNSDFEGFLELLNTHAVEYLVIGGYAVGFHAVPRFTKDLDVLVRPQPANAERVIAALTAFIGPPDISVERLSSPDLVLMLGIPPTRIDVLTSISGVAFEEAWPRRVEGPYGGQTVWFIGREDLIAAKLAAGREQDLIDVRRLEQAGRQD